MLACIIFIVVNAIVGSTSQLVIKRVIQLPVALVRNNVGSTDNKQANQHKRSLYYIHQHDNAYSSGNESYLVIYLEGVHSVDHVYPIPYGIRKDLPSLGSPRQ